MKLPDRAWPCWLSCLRIASQVMLTASRSWLIAQCRQPAGARASSGELAQHRISVLTALISGKAGAGGGLSCCLALLTRTWASKFISAATRTAGCHRSVA